MSSHACGIPGRAAVTLAHALNGRLVFAVWDDASTLLYRAEGYDATADGNFGPGRGVASASGGAGRGASALDGRADRTLRRRAVRRRLRADLVPGVLKRGGAQHQRCERAAAIGLSRRCRPA